MTEHEWQIGIDPEPMVRTLGDDQPVVARKLRHFAVACCRRPGPSETCRAALELADRYASTGDPALGSRLHSAHEEAMQVAWEIGEVNDEQRYWSARAVASACYDDMFDLEKGACGAAAFITDRLDDPTIRRAELAAQADLLRDVIGNPFRPVSVDPRWQTSDVLALCRGIDEDRAFDRLPILADALQNAGCDNADVLAHCRGRGPHVRGCWAVDVVAGRGTVMPLSRRRSRRLSPEEHDAEHEWLCGTVGSMECSLGTIRQSFGIDGVADARKCRLFAVACCRRIWHVITDERSRAAVEWADRYACTGDPAAIAPMNAAQAAARDAYREIAGASGEFNGAYDAACAAHGAASPFDCGTAEAAYASIREAIGVASCAARASSNSRREPFDPADLLRDVIGNPFRPVSVDPRWQTSDVLALCRGIDEDRAFDRLPILADALQNAGCDNADVLAHCRGRGPHVRGCWVVDLLLGQVPV